MWLDIAQIAVLFGVSVLVWVQTEAIVGLLMEQNRKNAGKDE